ERRGLTDAGDRGADPVAVKRVGKGSSVAPDLSRRRLITGGGAGAQQFVEESGRGAQGSAVLRTRSFQGRAAPTAPRDGRRSLHGAVPHADGRSRDARGRSSPRAGRRRRRG